MKYLRPYTNFDKLLESSSLSKAQLVDSIKYLSNWLWTYMRDYNNHSDTVINFTFSFGNLDIINIFHTVERLNHNSPDGFITAIANEFIIWSMYYSEERYRWSEEIRTGNLHRMLPEILFLSNYDGWSNAYKSENKWELYNQKLRITLYIYIDERIKQMISGTRWDIPVGGLKFSKKDEEFVLDCILSDYNVKLHSIGIRKSNKSVDLRIPFRLDYDSDFMWRLQSYFGGVLIKGDWVCLPFYRK